MERLFTKSLHRTSISLNGQWNLRFDPDNLGARRGHPRGKGLDRHVTYVPSCWNFELGRYDYMGVAWYSREFVTTRKRNSRLVFHAVSGQAEVYLDGKHLGGHYGSYTRFHFDIPDLKAGRHLLVVKVDNTVNDVDTLPLRFVDWFVYGGIYRGVELEQFDDVAIDGMRIDTKWKGLKVDQVAVTVQLTNFSNSRVAQEVKVSVDGREVGSRKVRFAAGGQKKVTLELDDFAPKLWDLEKPNLHMFHVCCGADDLFERTGFRKIAVRGKKILLNGREVFIKGVNRHNDDPELGHAISPPLILRDMQIIKDLGCNAVRMSHYPNDPIVLDYCDQMGLLVWEELAFWNHPAESLASERLEERSRTMLREMVERDYNHPGIVFWSIQNESKSSSREGRRLFKKLGADIRKMDTSRLVSFASACGKKDICFDLLDVVCWNMYPGWYDDDRSLDDLDVRMARSLRGNRRWLKEKGHNKPYLITEFGAGALLGEMTFHEGVRWTENYQEKLLDKAIRGIVESKATQGFFIWQFSDTRTALLSRISIGRPRTFNNKGLVDEHRKPKLAYYKVRDLLRSIDSYR